MYKVTKVLAIFWVEGGGAGRWGNNVAIHVAIHVAQIQSLLHLMTQVLCQFVLAATRLQCVAQALDKQQLSLLCSHVGRWVARFAGV